MLNLKKYKKIHMVGIKGVGMAALAGILKKNGFEISGSDIKEDFITTKDALLDLNIPISDFSGVDFSDFDMIVKSNAYNENNNKLICKAKKDGFPVFSYSDVVSSLFNNAFGIAVAGSHGKTTTAAMLSDILKRSKMNITALVGSRVIDWGGGYLFGDISSPDSIFVLEADEYKKVFLKYMPKIAVITSVDYDHPDCYLDEREYKEAFFDFIKNISDDGVLVINKNIKNVDDFVKKAKCKVIFYGEDDISDIDIKFPGVYNKLNAGASYLVARELSISKNKILESLKAFNGTARRFEILGEKNGILVIDDYAHHPSEIKAVLLGARNFYKDRFITAVFQPHTYSRTKRFSEDFGLAFSDADQVVITDVYSSAREVLDLSFNVRDVTEKIGDKAHFIKDKNEILGFLKNFNSTFCGKNGSLVIFMGAGDIYKTAKEYLNNLS